MARRFRCSVAQAREEVSIGPFATSEAASMITNHPLSTSRRRIALVACAAAFALRSTAAVSVFSAEQREWRDYAGGPDSSRFVAATQITKSNVSQLAVAWTYPAGQTDFNPLVVRGVVYGRGPNDSFVALDAATGKQIWIHEGVQGFNARGVNYWENKDAKDRRLIFSSNNLLQELDAQTGEAISSFGSNGRVDLRVGLDRDPATINQQSRTPGRVFENLLILGSATNQEYGSAPGDIRAFDVRTGALAWTFHTVPRPGEFGYDTWPADAWKTIGGANNWGEQSIDSKRGILYVPTGSAKFNFYGGNRKGANLFGDCIIALDVRTGKRLWHFQTVHHDIWDLDNNSAPQLTTIRHEGRSVDVVAVASKTGYLYVFDRVTGQPIWPIEERPVPQGTTVPGEVLSPTQPFPTAPPPFSRQKFTADNINPYILTAEEREQFRQRVLKARNDGPFTPIGFDEVIHMPGNQGGSNWGSTASNPKDGSVFVIGFNVPTIIRLLKPGETRTGRGAVPPEVVKEGRYLTEGFGLYPTIVNPPYTTLTGYDLNAGAIKWQIGLGDDLRLVGQGITGTGTAAMSKGGIIATATGLLFVTAADRKVHVYDSATGKQVSELPLGAPTTASPSMYELDGRQYLLVTASAPTGGRGGRGGADAGSTSTSATPPIGIIAYALPRN
jgi:quinoprotein glucose dehydrogenase